MSAEYHKICNKMGRRYINHVTFVSDAVQWLARFCEVVVSYENGEWRVSTGQDTVTRDTLARALCAAVETFKHEKRAHELETGTIFKYGDSEYVLLSRIPRENDIVLVAIPKKMYDDDDVTSNVAICVNGNTMLEVTGHYDRTEERM